MAFYRCLNLSLETLNFLVSFAGISVLFALIFKFVCNPLTDRTTGE